MRFMTQHSENDISSSVNPMETKKTKINKDEKPFWFDTEITKEEMTQEEQAEMDELLSKFR